MKPIEILVLCTGNSCRSILAEVLLNELGMGRFRAHSAGSKPAGAVNPGALQKLADEGHSISALASKSWDDFSGPEAPDVDIVITVCDSAAGESCPLWNGSPVTVHWGIPDPADATADDVVAAFDKTYSQLRSRVELALAVPLESMDYRQRKDALLRIHDACLSNEASSA